MNTEAIEAKAKPEARLTTKSCGEHGRVASTNRERKTRSTSREEKAEARPVAFYRREGSGGNFATALSNGPYEYFRQYSGYLRPRHGLGIVAYRRCRVPSRAVA